MSYEDIDWVEDFASSNVEAFGYDDQDEVLYVKFHNGSIYGYDVGVETFWAMDAAGSKGQFVWVVLRGNETGRYE